MSVNDQYGLSLSSASQKAARGYDAYVQEFLSYGPALRDFFQIADETPGHAFLNAHAAALQLSFEGAEGWAGAKPYLENMQAAGASGLSEREGLFCQAVSAWARKDFHQTLARLDELTARDPADICALKWGQYHAFNLGDQEALLRFGERVRDVHNETPYAHGMVAFALEQNHRLEEAEQEGYRAVEIALDDGWAHHAVAHVMETQGRAADGVLWLDHCAHTWERKGVFIRDHNWWHAALFRLGLDQIDEALAIFDARLWGEWPEFPQEQIGAVSALWRFEMRGADVGERWAPVVEQARARAGEHILPFHDLHYLYALSRAGAPGEGAALLASIRDHSEAQEGVARAIWFETCLPCAEALYAYANDDFAAAAQKLSAVEPVLARIGGSHAQRHVFAETRQSALKAAGKRAAAQ